MFYDFRQNNSGGGFDFNADDGISVHVIIEANSAEDANERAENLGLYFDGCDDGRDCECCGDRWYSAWGEGDAVPSMYGTPVGEAEAYMLWAPEGVAEAYVHYLDGRVEAVDMRKRKTL
jgi:hypothetical protein